MKNPFQPFLDGNGVVILDGAMATELERRGADLDDPLWSAKVLVVSPELIRGAPHMIIASHGEETAAQLIEWIGALEEGAGQEG